MFIIVPLLIVGVLFFLAKTGRLGPPPWVAQRHSPEGEARRILAERFANGDITSEEFLERASALNWTPGVDGPGHHGSKRRT